MAEMSRGMLKYFLKPIKLWVSPRFTETGKKSQLSPPLEEEPEKAQVD